MTLLFDTLPARSETPGAATIKVVMRRLIGFALLLAGAAATAMGMLVLIEHVVATVASTLAVNALLPFLG